jgi:hypothetical protein
MSNQDFGGDRSSGTGNSQSTTSRMRDAASDALSQASEMARDAGEKAKRAASETASSVTGHVKGLLDEQIGSGADVAGHLASSVRLAADDLSRQSPVLGGVVRGLADRIERYADDLQDQTVDQLVRTAGDFTRRQPALVFGIAALAGFFMFRTLKSAPSITSPSIQPEQGGAPGVGRRYQG